MEKRKGLDHLINVEYFVYSIREFIGKTRFNKNICQMSTHQIMFVLALRFFFLCSVQEISNPELKQTLHKMRNDC